jgi:hypothetical protein
MAEHTFGRGHTERSIRFSQRKYDVRGTSRGASKQTKRQRSNGASIVPPQLSTTFGRRTPTAEVAPTDQLDTYEKLMEALTYSGFRATALFAGGAIRR